MPDVSSELHLLAEVRLGTDRLKREISYNPSYFTRMIGEHGPAQTGRLLVRAAPTSDGFTTLYLHGRLDMSIEALMLLPWYSDLFDDDDTDLARRRLDSHDFDVPAFLASRLQSPPDWFVDGAAVE